MKTCIVLLALVALASAQHFDDLIRNEVASILAIDPNLTVDQCTTKCDALFDLVDAGDEQRSDDVCKHTCDCEINKTCGHHTQAPHTHPTHPTQHPHPTHPPHPDHGHHP